MMELEIDVFGKIPGDLDALDLTPDGAWVGVAGSAQARDLLFGGHRVRTTLACRFPLIGALDPETAVLVDARTGPGRPNAWIIRADGEQTAEFVVGDAVQGVAVVGERFVITHFDEGYGNPLHGMLVFDRTGELKLDYRRHVPNACEIVDCHAVGPAGRHSVLLLTYPDFPLAEVDLAQASQRVWETPAAVHGAGALSAQGRTVYFHGCYADQSVVHAWERGSDAALRVGSFAATLRGLGGGWFLGRQNDRFVRVRFSAMRGAA
jgi:hypothetical protein